MVGPSTKLISSSKTEDEERGYPKTKETDTKREQKGKKWSQGEARAKAAVVTAVASS